MAQLDNIVSPHRELAHKLLTTQSAERRGACEVIEINERCYSDGSGIGTPKVFIDLIRNVRGFEPTHRLIVVITKAER
jgi:hypothetical protein